MATPESRPETQRTRANEALIALVHLLARQAAAEAVRAADGTDEKPGPAAAAEPAG